MSGYGKLSAAVGNGRRRPFAPIRQVLHRTTARPRLPVGHSRSRGARAGCTGAVAITIADFLRARLGEGTAPLAAGVIALSATIWSAAQLFAFATIIDSASPRTILRAARGATVIAAVIVEIAVLGVLD